MSKAITAHARKELIAALRDRYASSTRDAKARILDEFIAVSGYHRKHAIRILNSQGHPVSPSRRTRQPRLYDEAVRQTVVMLWEASDRVCGKRLRPLLGTLLPALERHGHLRLDDAIRAKVLGASAATLDRLLSGARRAAGGRKRRGATASLRQLVAVRTFADWADPLPGCMEADLVAHCGDTLAGSFIHTLVLTDICTGWIECVPLLVRGAALVAEAIEMLRCAMPFPLRALDTDNGSEFMNETVVQYCIGHGIEFTRSRPHHKNDQAWVEQKNGAVVRRLVGYRRFQGIAAAQALSRLYAASRLFVNFFQPSFKLAAKTRVGARVTKRYHPPETPCGRLLAHDSVEEAVKTRLREVSFALDPLALLNEIRTVQQCLATNVYHSPSAIPREGGLSQFLTSLTTAWRAGEVRPTHRVCVERKRDWRTRADPFDEVWSAVQQWLEFDPDQTGIDLLRRLQVEHPGAFPDGQLRTLQRRLKDWRQTAARKLLFAPASAAVVASSGNIPIEPSSSISE